MVSEETENMNLQIKYDIAKSAEDIISQTKRLIDGTVSALHVQNNAGIIGNTEVVSNFSRHRNDLGAANFFLVVDQKHNRLY